MALPRPNLVGAAQTAARHMADRDTPFVMNEWYVAALAEEVGHALFARTLLGKRVVMFRTSEGKPVALDDRCAHRSFPLSSGALDGDTIVCGYHGFRYNADGDWIEVPSQPRCPASVGVRRYPLIEKGPFIWIWMGDAPADESRLPPMEWAASPQWAFSTGCMPMKGNYVSLHENLVDLTHLSYLHINSFGTPDYARAPFDVEITDDTFAVLRDVVPTKLPPLWAKSTGLENTATAARIVRSEFLSPALHLTSVSFYESTLPVEGRPEFHIKTAHLPTPETNGSTHYFVIIGRDFAIDDPSVTRFIHDNLFVAFREDKEALERLEIILAERDESFYEISVASDKASVAMRRYLKARADSERGARPAAEAVAAE